MAESAYQDVLLYAYQDKLPRENEVASWPSGLPMLELLHDQLAMSD
jgi:hypothetical protein